MWGLLVFLAVAVGLYIFLKWRFGAEHVNGHVPEVRNIPERYTDPVCGLSVEANKGYGTMYKGREYRFCSLRCLADFDADPERYVHSTGA